MSLHSILMGHERKIEGMCYTRICKYSIMNGGFFSESGSNGSPMYKKRNSGAGLASRNAFIPDSVLV